MHIHIEQHIIALVVTNAVEADRVDIGEKFLWLSTDCQIANRETVNIPPAEGDTTP